jgi:hypothetical protein
VRDRTTLCRHCWKPFRPSRRGHVYCTPECRHAGPLKWGETPYDPQVVARLFDDSRDPGERVKTDEWFSPADAPPAVRALYAHETVGQRRRWYRKLQARA